MVGYNALCGIFFVLRSPKNKLHPGQGSTQTYQVYHKYKALKVLLLQRVKNAVLNVVK